MEERGSTLKNESTARQSFKAGIEEVNAVAQKSMSKIIEEGCGISI